MNKSTPYVLRNISEAVGGGQWLVVSDFGDELRDCSLATSHCFSNVRICPVTSPIRMLAVDIDGTLLNSQFQISQVDIDALRRAHESGVEVLLVTGRRHTFALPMAQQLGFDLWLISSNGAVTRSLAGGPFHRDLMPAPTCRELVRAMQEFRGQTVLTFDSNDFHSDTAGTIVIERLDELEASIQRWLEKNMQYIQFVIPIEK